MTNDEQYDDGKVECKECGKRYQFITANHLKTHNMTTDEYKAKYPDAKIAGTMFSTKQKYRNKKIFEKKETEESEKTIDMDNLVQDEDLPLPDENDDLNIYKDKNNKNVDLEYDEFESLQLEKDKLENLDKDKMIQSSNEKFDKIRLKHKKEVAYYLNTIFPDVIHDYFIKIINHEGHLLHNFVTDFCDPKRKTIFFFPDVYWHNEESPSIENKYRVLREYGWTIFEFKGIDVIEEIKKFF